MSAPDQPTMGRRAVLGGALGLIALGALPSLAACGSGGSGGGAAVPDVPGLRVLPADFAREVLPVAQAPGVAAVVAGMRTFGAQLHAVAATSGANFTASPLSIALATGMLRAGSRRRTASQIDHLFGFPSKAAAPQGSAHAALGALAAALVTTRPVDTAPQPEPSDGPPPDSIVAIVNGLFVEESFSKDVQPAFLRLLATQYGAHATAVHFHDASAVATINRWVAQQTRDRIKVLFDSLDASTKLVLANAIYLKAAWRQPFLEQTVEGSFTTAEGATVRAQLMHQVLEEAPYEQSESWQRVTLPYADGRLSIRIVLPRQAVRAIPALNALLPVATRPRSGDSMSMVDLTLPRWSTGTDLSLVKPLEKLGMTDAFSDLTADLTGIAPGLYVSDAVHRANITVDEKGTEAAAVTGYAVADSARIGPPMVMRVDRPFVWAVVHEATGTPIFVGHVVDPTA